MNQVNLNRKQQQHVQTLNTKGCCFICLKIINLKTEFNEYEDEGSEISRQEPVSLKCLQRYLKINTKRPPPNQSAVLKNKKTCDNGNCEEIQTNLCKLCTRIMGNFSTLFRQLEKTQMEINCSIDAILRQIEGASKLPEVVQNYSKRMTSDLETLTQLVFVDHFRKEIARKGSTKKAALLLQEPQICLTPLQNVEKYLSRQRKPSPAPSLQEENENYDEDLQDDGHDGNVQNLICSDKDEDKNGINLRPPGSSDSVFSLDSTPQITTLQSVAHTQENKSIPNWQTKRKYKCKTCTLTFSYEKCLQKHEMRCEEDVRPQNPAKSPSHSEVKPWITKTNVRSIRFTSKQSNLTKSMYEINKETGKYACVVCGKEYGCQKGVCDHYNAFHLKKIHKCETCSAVFGYPQSLRLHKRICKDLGQRQLAQKKAKESDPRYRFICKVCGKRFKQKCLAEEHQRNIHLKQRNFPCDLCSKTFQYLADMLKHKDAVHFGKTWSCKFCKKQFKWNTTRRKHEKTCTTRPIMKLEIIKEGET